MAGATSQPQAVAAESPTQESIGKLRSQGSCEAASVYAAAAAKVHSSAVHARAHSPSSSTPAFLEFLSFVLSFNCFVQPNELCKGTCCLPVSSWCIAAALVLGSIAS